MTTATLTLTAFLLARIAEDEAAARAAYGSPWEAAGSPTEGFVWTANSDRTDDAGPTVYVNGGVYANQRRTAVHIARHDPARVLADCEAKRRIVANCQAARRGADAAPLSERVSSSDGPSAAYWRGQDWVCRTLAVVYSDHPDYRDDWRP